MGRGKLEGLLDGLFADRLTKPAFLENCVETLRQRSIQTSSGVDIARLTAELKALQRKRERVIDGFVEGVIRREERDQRLIAIEDGIRVAQDTLAREPADRSFDTGKLIEAFAPLVEWEYWTRDQKRQVLSTLIPDIRVSDYKIDSLGLSPSLFSHEDTHRDKGNFIAESPALSADDCTVVTDCTEGHAQTATWNLEESFLCRPRKPKWSDSMNRTLSVSIRETFHKMNRIM